jgi:hypothetical protein
VSPAATFLLAHFSLRAGSSWRRTSVLVLTCATTKLRNGSRLAVPVASPSKSIGAKTWRSDLASPGLRSARPSILA